MSLEYMESLSIPFVGVDYASWDPKVHDTYLKPEGKNHLIRVARSLQNSTGARVKILGFCGPPYSSKSIALASLRTRVVQEFLLERGCQNEFVFEPIGFECHDLKGPRCEIKVCPVIQEKAAPAPELVLPMPVIMPEPVKEEIVPVPAPVPEPVPVVPAPYLSVTFGFRRVTESGCVTRTWLDRPLGFTYATGAWPVRVTKVVKGSKAHIFGVEEGMEVQAIEFTGQGKVECVGQNFQEVNDLLVAGASILPHETDRPWLTLLFRDPENPSELKSKTWYTKPLGLTFTRGVSPVRICQVDQGGRSFELGVRVGMEIMAVEVMGRSATDVTTMTCDEVQDVIAHGMRCLAEVA